MAADPYVDPRTGLLRNLLGISDAVELARAEARLVAVREFVLFQERLDLGSFDLSHLQAVHRHLFGRIYDWAGQLRTVNMTKGETLFALAEWVEPQGREIFAGLARQRLLRGLDRQPFVTAAGRFLSDLNALHPFREGNGRTQRAFIQLLSNQAGWQLAWARVDPAENTAAAAKAMADRDAFVPLLDRIVVSDSDSLPPENLALPHEAEPAETDTPPSRPNRDKPWRIEAESPSRGQIPPGGSSGGSRPISDLVAYPQDYWAL